MRKPGERALHDLASRDDMETRFRQILRPIDLVGRDIVGNPVALETMDRLDRLHAPASDLLDPVAAFATPVIARIQPEQAHAWQLLSRRLIQDQLDAITVHDAGRMDIDHVHQSFLFDQDVAFAPHQLLGPIIAAHAADVGRFDRLAVHRPHGGLRLTVQLQAETLAQRVMDALPRPIAPPASKIPVHGQPRRSFLGQEAPGTAGPQDVKDRVQNRAQRMHTRTTGGLVRWPEWLEQRPFSIHQIGGVERGLAVHASAYARPPDARCEL